MSLSLLPWFTVCALGLHRLVVLRLTLLDAQLMDMFITRAFFYPNSTMVDDDLFASRFLPRTNMTIVLITADRRLASARSPSAVTCTTASGAVAHSTLQALHLGYGHAPCRMAIFRVLCYPLALPNNREIGIRIHGRIGLIRLNVTLADQMPRQLVLCPGRSFLFDQWHLFLAFMELCRLHRVSLVLAHIHSVHPALLPLFRLYERVGLLRIRASLRMPVPEHSGFGMFDPNTETLWNNQLVDFHDALYEFRQSAAFVGFPDWDDLLITPGSAPLPAALHAFIGIHPEVAALIPKRFPGHLPTLAQMRSSGMDMAELLQRGLHFSSWPSDAQFISKVLVRPALVASVDLHAAGLLSPGYKAVEVPAELAFFVHARDYQNSRMNQFLPSGALLASAFRGHNLSLLAMPTEEQFLATTNVCLARVEAKVRANRHSKCFNYAQCRKELEGRMKMLGGDRVLCLGAQNHWRNVWHDRWTRVQVLVEARLAPLRGVQCLP